MAAPLTNIGINLLNHTKDVLSHIKLEDVEGKDITGIFAKDRFKSLKSSELVSISTKSLRSMSWQSLQDVKESLKEQIDETKKVALTKPGFHIQAFERKKIKQANKDFTQVQKKMIRFYSKIQNEEKKRYQALNAILKWNQKEKEIWAIIDKNPTLKTAYKEFRKETERIDLSRHVGHGVYVTISTPVVPISKSGIIDSKKRTMIMKEFYKFLDAKLLKGDVLLKDLEPLANNKKYIVIPVGHVRNVQLDVSNKEKSRERNFIRILYNKIIYHPERRRHLKEPAEAK